MQKKLFIIILVASIITACSNNQSDSETTADTDNVAITEQVILTVTNFDETAQDYVGKEVQIAGLVNHTCKHGGKRMFIVEEGSKNSVKIEAGEKISSFDAELEGSEVLVTGIINELIIDEAYLIEWEAEIKEELAMEEDNKGDENAEEGVESEEGSTGETEEHEHESGFERIEEIRKQIAESEKDHLSFYSIECLSYEIIPPTEE